MFSYFKSAVAVITTVISFSFAQDVTLTIDGTSLNYESQAKTKLSRVEHSPPRSTSVPLPKETKLPVKENPKHVVSEHEIIKPAAPESPPDAPDAQPS